MNDFAAAPEWSTSRWYNSKPLELGDLSGRVVVLHAFQMLCPGCVQASLPQAQKISRLFDPSRVAVIGLHTAFEHKAAMTEEVLEAFISEFRLLFPIAIDEQSLQEALPRTMSAYAMQGTPTLILIDQNGRLRKQLFGVEDDMRIGAEIGLLMSESL